MVSALQRLIAGGGSKLVTGYPVAPESRDGEMEELIVSTVYDGKRRKLFKRQCATCSADFYAPKHAGKRYCSQKCFRVSTRKQIERVCDLCGTLFARRPSSLACSRSGLVFCTRKCKDEAQRMGRYKAVLFPKHHKDGSCSYRKIAFRHYAAKCNRCGFDAFVGILRVHHRDRNRKNNHPDNLEILCPNCHEIDHLLNGDGAYGGGKKSF